MGARESRASAAIDQENRTAGASDHDFGIYIFLISFACVYYVSNASILLANTDLGWHLAAGDLIRDRAGIPFHDPWSFTSAGREWY